MWKLHCMECVVEILTFPTYKMYMKNRSFSCFSSAQHEKFKIFWHRATLTSNIFSNSETSAWIETVFFLQKKCYDFFSKIWLYLNILLYSKIIISDFAKRGSGFFKFLLHNILCLVFLGFIMESTRKISE